MSSSLKATLAPKVAALKKEIESILAAHGNDVIGEVTVSVQESSLTDRNQIGLTMDTFREQHRNAIAVLTTGGDRPGIHIAVTDDLIARGIKAGDIVNHLAALSGGKGGGRPHFASGSAGDPARFRETLERLPEVLAPTLAPRGN